MDLTWEKLTLLQINRYLSLITDSDQNQATKKTNSETEGKHFLSPFSKLNFTPGTSFCLAVSTGYPHSV